MKEVIEIEKVVNGYIITGKKTGVKKVTNSAVDLSKIIASELTDRFSSMRNGEVKSIEFDIKN